MKRIDKITDAQIILELKTFPTQAAIWEIVNLGIAGKIFELDGGGVMIHENSDSPFVFIAGVLTESTFKTVINYLKDFEYPIIYCKPLYHSFFLKYDFDPLLRAELILKDKESFLSKNSMDNSVIPIDNIELFQKCFWYKNNVELYGSIQNFFKYCLGYACVEGEEVISEAYATIGGGFMEVSVATHPDHRGKGSVVKAIVPLIEKCAEAGLIPMWTCQLDNRSSLKAALKIGFEIDRYYVTIVPQCGNVLGANLIKWMRDNPADLANPFL